MSLTGKSPADTYKDLLYVDNNNSGADSTIRTIKSGNGTNTLLGLSTRHMRFLPDADTTTTLTVRDADNNTKLQVDTTNDQVKALGHHINTQFKEFGIWDFSPTAGEHHNLITSPAIPTTLDEDFDGEVNSSAWGGTGTNPATSLTTTSLAKEYLPSIWLLQQNIYIDSIQYLMASGAASTINLHLMQYDIVGGSGSTAGDLSNGVVLAQTGSASDSLSPVTTGNDRVSNGTLTINTTNVSSGKAIILFAEASDTDDMTIQVTIKYHLT